MEKHTYVEQLIDFAIHQHHLKKGQGRLQIPSIPSIKCPNGYSGIDRMIWI